MNGSIRNTFWQVLLSAPRLWGLWMLATALPLGIVAPVVAPVPWMVLWMLSGATPLGILVALLGAAIVLLLAGAMLGLAQWLVIRRRGPRLRAWILVSALGAPPLATYVAQGLYVGSLERLPSWYFALGAAAGGVLGACQWVIVRRMAPRARWWIVGSMLGGVLCGITIQAPVSLGVPMAWPFQTIGLALMGSVTGITLLLLLHPTADTRLAALALSGLTVVTAVSIFVLLPRISSKTLLVLQTNAASTHVGAVEEIETSADGKLLVSFSLTDPTHGAITTWSSESWQELSVVEVPYFQDGILALSPDGQLLAQTDRLFNYDGPCHTTLWDTETGEPSRTLEGCGTDMVFSPDSGQLAIGGDDTLGTPPHSIRLMDVSSGAVVGEPAAVGRLDGLAFSVDGKRMAVGGHQYEYIGVWDVETGELLTTFRECQGVLEALVFSPDDRFLVAGCSWFLDHAGEVKAWEVATGKEIAGRGIAGDVVDLAVSPDSRLLAVAFNDDHAVHLYDLEGGRPTHTLLGHTEPVTAVVFLRDSGYLASGSYDGTVRIWDVAPASD